MVIEVCSKVFYGILSSPETNVFIRWGTFLPHILEGGGSMFDRDVRSRVTNVLGLPWSAALSQFFFCVASPERYSSFLSRTKRILRNVSLIRFGSILEAASACSSCDLAKLFRGGLLLQMTLAGFFRRAVVAIAIL